VVDIEREHLDVERFRREPADTRALVRYAIFPVCSPKLASDPAKLIRSPPICRGT
jgi:hypothetical protein